MSRRPTAWEQAQRTRRATTLLVSTLMLLAALLFTQSSMFRAFAAEVGLSYGGNDAVTLSQRIGAGVEHEQALAPLPTVPSTLHIVRNSSSCVISEATTHEGNLVEVPCDAVIRFSRTSLANFLVQATDSVGRTSSFVGTVTP